MSPPLTYGAGKGAHIGARKAQIWQWDRHRDGSGRTTNGASRAALQHGTRTAGARICERAWGPSRCSPRQGHTLNILAP